MVDDFRIDRWTLLDALEKVRGVLGWELPSSFICFGGTDVVACNFGNTSVHSGAMVISVDLVTPFAFAVEGRPLIKMIRHGRSRDVYLSANEKTKTLCVSLNSFRADLPIMNAHMWLRWITTEFHGAEFKRRLLWQ